MDTHFTQLPYLTPESRAIALKGDGHILNTSDDPGTEEVFTGEIFGFPEFYDFYFDCF